MNQRSAWTRGFTPIEILIVIAILGILAAIPVPVISSIRRKANRAACLSNLHQIELAVNMYTTDHRHFQRQRICRL